MRRAEPANRDMGTGHASVVYKGRALRELPTLPRFPLLPILAALMLASAGCGCAAPGGAGGSAGASGLHASTSIARAASGGALACGRYPAPAPASGVPTPDVASAGVAAGTAAPATVIGAWPTCFRPGAVTILSGELVQWQAATSEIIEVRLDNGIDLGPILHVLEVRFNRPGRYPYRGNEGSGATGTITVIGPPIPGPALEIATGGGRRTLAEVPSAPPGSPTGAPTGGAAGPPQSPLDCAVTKPIPPFVPPPPFLPSPPRSYRSAWYGSAQLSGRWST